MKRRLAPTVQSMGFLVRNRNCLRAYQRLERMRATLVRANMELGKLGYGDALYVQRASEFDQAVIYATDAASIATCARNPVYRSTNCAGGQPCPRISKSMSDTAVRWQEVEERAGRVL